MNESRVKCYFILFRNFCTYFTALLLLSTIVKSHVGETVLSYIDFALPFSLLVFFWGTYFSGKAYISPNSDTIKAVRLIGPLLLILAVLMGYSGAIGSLVDRRLMSYFFLLIIGLCSIGFITCIKDSGFKAKNSRIKFLHLLQRSNQRLSQGEKWYLIGVFNLAAGLRLYRLSAHSFIADEAIHLAAGQSIQTSLLPALPSGLVYLRGFVFSYLVSASMFVFGANEFGVRFPSVVFGIMLVLVGFTGGSIIFDKQTGLISAFLIAIDPFLIGFSRVGRFYILFYLLVLIAVILFYTSFIQKRTSKWWFEIIAIFAVLTHRLTLLLFPVFFFWWIGSNETESSWGRVHSDIFFLTTPPIIWILYLKLIQYVVPRTIPGEMTSEIQNPIFGMNIYSIHFYWEVLLHPYTIFILLALPVLLYTLYCSATYKFSYEVSYLSSFIFIYATVLGYAVIRNDLRFIVVIVPILLLLFARMVSYLVETVLSSYCRYILEIHSEYLNRRFITIVIITAIIITNFAVGSIVIERSSSLRDIPEEKEKNQEILKTHIRGNEYAFQSKVTHYLFMNTRDASHYAISNHAENSIVISTSNFGPVDAYLPVDYNANYHLSTYLGYELDGIRYDRYRGTPIISNETMARKIYRSCDRVWVIADVRFKSDVKPEVKEYIKKKSDVVYVSKVSNTSKHSNVFGERSQVRIYYHYNDTNIAKKGEPVNKSSKGRCLSEYNPN